MFWFHQSIYTRHVGLFRVCLELLVIIIWSRHIIKCVWNHLQYCHLANRRSATSSLACCCLSTALRPATMLLLRRWSSDPSRAEGISVALNECAMTSSLHLAMHVKSNWWHPAWKPLWDYPWGFSVSTTSTLLSVDFWKVHFKTYLLVEQLVCTLLVHICLDIC